jgi:hypothetical protein
MLIIVFFGFKQRFCLIKVFGRGQERILINHTTFLASMLNFLPESLNIVKANVIFLAVVHIQKTLDNLMKFFQHEDG